MAKIDVYGKLSKQAKQEIINIVEKKESAYDMIVNNYYKDNCNYSSNDICTRMQMQHFALNPNENSLQQDGRNGWWQNEAHEPNTVNTQITPVIKIEGDEDKWGANYYSSFALKELDGKYNLRYPLDDDYTSSVSPFFGLSMPTINYNVAARQIQKKLNVKIVNGKVAGKNLYKRSFINLALVKIKNTALKMAGKPEQAKTAFKGKLTLADSSKGAYKYSNIEKMVRIYDELFRVGIAKQVKYSKGKYKGATRDEKFAARLFADMLMARIIDFGDININKKVEKCISLQFANVLNRSPFSSEEMKLVTELGVNIVADTCERLGMTKNTIIMKMMLNDFQYPKTPMDIKEALLLAKEKDYSRYEMNGQNKKQIKQVEPIRRQQNQQLLNAANQRGMLPSGREKTQLIPSSGQGRITNTNQNINQNQSRQATSLIEAGHKNQSILPVAEKDGMLVLPETNKLVSSQKNSAALPETQQRQELPEGSKAKQALLGGGNREEQLAIASKQIAGELESPHIAGYLPPKKIEKVKSLLPMNMYNTKTISDRLILSLQTDFDKQPPEVLMGKVITKSKNITKKSIEKAIDKIIIKLLSEKVVSINKNLNAHRYSVLGGRQAGEQASDVYSQVLSYYTNFTNTKKSLDKMRDEGTLYTRAKQLCEHIIEVKQKTIHSLTNGNDAIEKQEGESSAKILNEKMRELTRNAGHPNGLSVRDFFKSYLEKLPKIYNDFKQIDEQTKQ